MKENTTNLKQSDRERELQMYPLDSWAIITKKQNENEKPTMNLKRSCCLAGGERREIRIGNVILILTCGICEIFNVFNKDIFESSLSIIIAIQEMLIMIVKKIRLKYFNKYLKY